MSVMQLSAYKHRQCPHAVHQMSETTTDQQHLSSKQVGLRNSSIVQWKYTEAYTTL